MATGKLKGRLSADEAHTVATPRLRSAERLFLRQRPNLCLERCPRPDQIAHHPTNEPAKVITQEHVRFSIHSHSDKVCNTDQDFPRWTQSQLLLFLRFISCRRDVFRSDPHAWNRCSYEVMRRFPGSYGSDVRPTWPKPRPAIS